MIFLLVVEWATQLATGQPRVNGQSVPLEPCVWQYGSGPRALPNSPETRPSTSTRTSPRNILGNFGTLDIWYSRYLQMGSHELRKYLCWYQILCAAAMFFLCMYTVQWHKPGDINLLFFTKEEIREIIPVWEKFAKASLIVQQYNCRGHREILQSAKKILQTLPSNLFFSNPSPSHHSLFVPPFGLRVHFIITAEWGEQESSVPKVQTERQTDRGHMIWPWKGGSGFLGAKLP